ncbi:hypothetical protein ABFU65_12170 [Xanthomonas campestris pv. raphani]|uniref:hypothetical protein n=1 Tax=Xanthomonas campestris TaxID=339 RepID=UPI002B2383F0|nr:hypothetical protein [Xanthomonas campestris]MEA9653047.1 hypothetical protein [Xanthomonas campestris pv. raphani]MEB1146726.1 hypothetical protein [Xanthomonas campestris pv. campestris]MEB1937038.1 hypothetical protein [Xanthomonas campestris pv. campestris]
MSTKQTPEQRAALARAKKPGAHPWRIWQGTPNQERAVERRAETIVPYTTRLITK